MPGRFAVAVTTAAVALATGLALHPTAAPAQSFNCRYARQPAEVAICQSQRLSALDAQMADLYYRLVNGGVGTRTAGLVEAEQGNWLQARDACGYDAGCLERAYLRRIGELSAY